MEWPSLIEDIYLAVSRIFDGFFKFLENIFKMDN